ncbi:MAG: sigma-70 family RNA polymerase sigma factor [Gemmatimonadetes bacterium]|nr:sigma-70 family RNA polymerase sigma factor [Gemmatimonadota bacterium]
MSGEPGQVTRLLARVSGGDDAALDELFPLVYGQLRDAADRALRLERPGHTLQPTALVHEAYLKLIGGTGLPSRDRVHFLALAARAMRQILVDHARRRRARKRGDGRGPVTLDHEIADRGLAFDEVLALDDALDRLSGQNPRLRKVVELKFFGGLGEDDIAAALGVTTRTVQRDWARARAWLYREVYDGRERTTNE